MRWRARRILSARASALVVSGRVLGISNTALTPPSTAARLPVSRSSFCSGPVSRKSTGVTLTHGSVCRHVHSITSPAAVATMLPSAAIRPLRMPTSRTPVPSWLTTVPPFSTRSNVSVIPRALHPLASVWRAAYVLLRAYAASASFCARVQGTGDFTMTSMNIAPLHDRGVVRVSGADAAKLLQGLITADLDLLQKQPAAFAGLLTPQGK